MRAFLEIISEPEGIGLSESQLTVREDPSQNLRVDGTVLTAWRLHAADPSILSTVPNQSHFIACLPAFAAENLMKEAQISTVIFKFRSGLQTPLWS